MKVFSIRGGYNYAIVDYPSLSVLTWFVSLAVHSLRCHYSLTLSIGNGTGGSEEGDGQGK